MKMVGNRVIVLLKKLVLLSLITLLLHCEPEWTNPLEVDEELKFTPEIKELKQTENHDILIVLNRVYSDSVELQFEREENEIYVPVKLSRYNLYSYIDSVFDKEVPHRFRYRYRVKKGDYTTEYSVSKGIDYSGDYLYGPVGVQKRVIELRGVQLRWRDRSQREEYYIIERDAGGGYEEIAELPANSESYLDSISGVYNPPLYLRYRIYARRGEVKSEALEYEVEYSGLGSPGNLRIADSSSWNFTIEWEDNSNIEDGYIVERSKDGLGYEEVARLSANSRSYTEVIEEEGSYSYRVRAYKGSYYSGYSNEVSITIKSLVPTKGLIAYYPFNGNANDESGNGNHGVVYGNATVNGVLIIGDNAEDRVSLPYNVLDGLKDFSFSAKLKINTLHSSGRIPLNCWLSGARNSEANALILAYSKNDNAWTVNINNVGKIFAKNGIIEDLKFHHIVIIRHFSTAYLYIDGVKIGNGIQVSNDVLSVDPGGVIIGQEQDVVSGSFEKDQSWAGEIDNIRIYNRALNENEISAIFRKDG